MTNNWQTILTIFEQKIELTERYKGVHFVDLGKSFPTHIYLQNLASIQPRTSPLKFARTRCVGTRHLGSGAVRPARPSAWAPPTRDLRAPLVPASRARAKFRGLVLGRIEAKFWKFQLILQENMRWKALAEIYTMHSFAPVYKLKILFKKSLKILPKICRILLDIWEVR